jgi:hypothetical protein
MLKDATNKEKFALLSQWMATIVEAIKKDLKHEHLKNDQGFVRSYFAGKNLNKLSAAELASAYSHAIVNGENGDELAEFVTNRWLLKHTDVYHFFEQELSRINPNFSQMEILDPQTSLTLMEDAVKHCGSPQTYLFSMLNSVVFPDDVYTILGKRAEQSVQENEQAELVKSERESFASMQQQYERQIARLTDKYEKKLLGLQKKYVQDTEALKKQVASLQRKLSAI